VPVPNCLASKAGDAVTDDPLRDPSARRENSTEEDVEDLGGMMEEVRSGFRAVEMMGGEVRMRKDV
jgi:hypothetical protein